ncbi:EH domain-binding protein 1 [Taenia crassiceps]|uniref:EH domain-binding protein 1 n=1 Tax=Taenia crassiceps TaxID=6207 RepID=A0ABR4Q538_9CEST
MSLWRRIQRIGMKAAKFQFTVSLEELSMKLEKGYWPKSVLIVFTRRGRRCVSQPITLCDSSSGDSSFSYTWTLPDNLEVVTTLYRNEKDISFEDKEWTFQVEDVCMPVAEFKEALPPTTTRRRVLATRSLNLAEFASALPTQNNLKVNLRAASKKVSSATLLFTLHGLMLRSGEATDEDMISVASSMSLTYAPPSAYGSRWSNESSIPESEGFYNDLSSISNQLQTLERFSDLHEADEEETEVEMEPTKVEVGKDTKGTQNSQTDINGSMLPISQSGSQAKVTSQTGQDLLAWCQEVTAAYAGVKIKDLTICFRSGLALCAIIHHFQPEAIGDFELVRAMTPTERVRLAFDVAGRLGVARVFVDPCEVVRGRGGAPDRLSMMTYLHQLRACLVAANEGESESESEKTVSATPLDGAADHQRIESEEAKRPVIKHKTKTKKEKHVNPGSGSASERYEQLLTKARTLLMESKTSDRSDHLRTATAADGDSESTSPSSLKHEIDGALSTTGNVKARKLKLSNLKLFTDVMETHLSSDASPSKSSMPSTLSDLNAEAAAVAAEQEALDREAPDLERRLRAVMGSGTPEEETLMRRWFQLISRRNALVHRSYKLSIMQKESDLERTTVLLNAELRELMEKDDSQKTAEDRAREELLLREVVQVVNERNEIVQELDYQEQALVNEVELGLQTDAITQQTFRAISGGGDAGTLRSCIIQ